ncbi:hypothetical protein NBRC116494_32930 [Aurantivibrio plasticivorans]
MTGYRSISLKLWLPILLSISFGGLWLILVLDNYSSRKEEIISRNLDFVRYDIASLVREMESNIQKDQLAGASITLAAKSANINYIALAATDHRGNILFSARPNHVNEPASSLFPDFNKNVIAKLQSEKTYQITYSGDEEKIIAYAPLTLAAEANELRSLNVGSIFIVFDLSHQLQNVKHAIFEQSAYTGVFFIAILGGLWLIFYKFVQLPVKHIVDSTKNLYGQRDGVVCRIQGNGELYEIAESFNAMTAELDLRSFLVNKAEYEITLKDSLFDSLFLAIPDTFFLLDDTGNVIDLRTSDHQDPHTPATHLVGENIRRFFPSDVAAHYSHAMATVKELRSLQIIEYSLSQDQQDRHFESRINYSDSNKQFLVVIRDITERKHFEEKILYQAHYDSLTKLPNRFLAMDRLSQQLKNAARTQSSTAVVFLDLDDFKKINDTLGHETGDALLIATANRLKACVRSQDTIARLGGDEFILVTASVDSSQSLTHITETLLNAFDKPFYIHDREIIISASAGISTYPDDGNTPSDLLRKADAAMYSAKSKGRNAFSFFTDSMNKEAYRQLSIEEQLHGALEREEVYVVFQPQFGIASREIVGAEALLRWQNPKLGSVSPAEFIPIAEKTGKIIALGNFVLEQSLKAFTSWQAFTDENFRIAVNLSPRQFRGDRLTENIVELLQHYGVEAKHIELEITEGVLLGEQGFVTEELEKLSRSNIQLAMDDFGTGYSSLSYLRSYPFKALKIDRSFVSDIGVKPDATKLIHAIIEMAHGLDLQVVAEGIETEEQLTTLDELDCDIGQGFYLGKPVRASELKSRIINV